MRLDSGVKWCDKHRMTRPKGKRKQARISVSFEDADYAYLSGLARQRDLPIAWLVRQAVHGFIEREQAEAVNLALPFVSRRTR